MMGCGYIAVDWGTTNRRAYLIDGDGRVVETACDAAGVLALAPADFPRAVAELRARFATRPIILAGMVGSDRGWREIPYVDAPATLADLAAATVEIDDGIWIVPGVASRAAGRCDVMRGEEVQVLGAVAAGLAPRDALLCQPGTHSKWIAVAGGRIVEGTTAMTGELFALLRGHGTLSGMLDHPVADGPAFRRGLARAAGAADLTVALFGVRAAVLLGDLAAADAAAFASGLLIGAEVGARVGLEGGEVVLLAGGALAPLYRAAIESVGGRTRDADMAIAFAAGIDAIRRRLP